MVEPDRDGNTADSLRHRLDACRSRRQSRCEKLNDIARFGVAKCRVHARIAHQFAIQKHTRRVVRPIHDHGKNAGRTSCDRGRNRVAGLPVVGYLT